MKIIEDIGLTDLEGKLVKKQYYLLVECPECKEHYKLRKASYGKSKSCDPCARKLRAQRRRQLIEQKLSKGFKSCSVCKKDLPLECFGKNSSLVHGLRTSCKECEKVQSAKQKADYRAKHKQEKATYDRKYRQQEHRKKEKLGKC